MFRTALTLSLVLLCAAFARPVAALTQEETDKIIKQIDYRQRSQGDYASQVYIERKERNKNDINYEAVVYRRTAGQKFVIMFQKVSQVAARPGVTGLEVGPINDLVSYRNLKKQ